MILYVGTKYIRNIFLDYYVVAFSLAGLDTDFVQMAAISGRRVYLPFSAALGYRFHSALFQLPQISRVERRRCHCLVI